MTTNSTISQQFESFIKDLNDEMHLKRAESWKSKERRKRLNKSDMPIDIKHVK